MSIICSVCKGLVEDGSLFCTNCGASLADQRDNFDKKNICGNCGNELEEGSAYCLVCGNVTEVIDGGQKQCPNCENYVDEDNVFCIYCGYNFTGENNSDNQKQCPECGEYVDEDNAFCIYCGHYFTNNLNKTSEEDVIIPDITPVIEDYNISNSTPDVGLKISLPLESKISKFPEIENAKYNFRPASLD